MSATANLFDIFGINNDPRTVTAEVLVAEEKFGLTTGCDTDSSDTKLTVHATRATKLGPDLTSVESTSIERLTVRIAGATLVFASSEAASRFAQAVLQAVDTTGPFDRSARLEATA